MNLDFEWFDQANRVFNKVIRIPSLNEEELEKELMTGIENVPGYQVQSYLKHISTLFLNVIMNELDILPAYAEKRSYLARKIIYDYLQEERKKKYCDIKIEKIEEIEEVVEEVVEKETTDDRDHITVSDIIFFGTIIMMFIIVLIFGTQFPNWLSYWWLLLVIPGFTKVFFSGTKLGRFFNKIIW